MDFDTAMELARVLELARRECTLPRLFGKKFMIKAKRIGVFDWVPSTFMYLQEVTHFTRERKRRNTIGNGANVQPVGVALAKISKI